MGGHTEIISAFHDQITGIIADDVVFWSECIRFRLVCSMERECIAFGEVRNGETGIQMLEMQVLDIIVRIIFQHYLIDAVTHFLVGH